MEAVSPFVTQAVESVSDVDAVPRHERATQTLTATAIYRLSEEGRKKLLLAGGDGREFQEITVAVPTNRIHLVGVDAEGHARLKLYPRYFLNGEQRVVCHEDPPMFDAVPTIEDLLKEAARNHQLERAYRIESAEHHQKKQDRLFELHQRVAEEFLAEPTRRARTHPRPTARRCYVVAYSQVFHYDTKTDHGTARQVPPEAYRRFCADERARTEKGRAHFDRGYTVHREKERLIADWVATYGTPDQQERHAAGLLPLAEVLEGKADEEFGAVADRPRYVQNGADRLQAYLRQIPRYANVVIPQNELRITTTRAEEATVVQWAILRELRAMYPLADVTLQRHRLGWTHDLHAPTLTIWTILLRRKIGPFNVRRELLAPQPDQSTHESFITEEAAIAVFDKTP